jgi:diamine N-acetyltransferase
MTDSTEPTSTTAAPPKGSVVTLRPVTAENVYDILRLAVTKEQEQFVADNARSLAEAAYNPFAWPRAIYAGDTPVGFVMLYDDPHTPEYFLWRLMIDHRFQRLGFAREALEQVVDYVAGRPNATVLGVSYVPGAGSPQPFYAAIGFVDTGEVIDDEQVMRLDISERAAITPPSDRALTHVVMFKFKKPTPALLDEAAARLRALHGVVPTLISIEVGLDVIHEGRSYDLVIINRFATQSDLAAYQEHPTHQEVLAFLRPLVTSSISVDFERD